MDVRAVAVAQTSPRAGDLAANVEEHVALLELAVGEGAELVVFPELSLTGYELELAAALALDADAVRVSREPRLEPLQSVVDEHGVVAAVGAPLRMADLTDDGGRGAGGALAIGTCILRPAAPPELYTKRHLGAFGPDANPSGGPVPPPENSVFRPGRLDPHLPVAGGTAAFAICADTSRDEHPRRARERGATLYAASLFFTPEDAPAELERLGGHAREHRMIVLAANFGAPTGGLEAGGASSIWTADGERVATLDGLGSGVAVATPVRGGGTARVVWSGDR